MVDIIVAHEEYPARSRSGGVFARLQSQAEWWASQLRSVSQDDALVHEDHLRQRVQELARQCDLTVHELQVATSSTHAQLQKELFPPVIELATAMKQELIDNQTFTAAFASSAAREVKRLARRARDLVERADMLSRGRVDELFPTGRQTVQVRTLQLFQVTVHT